MDVAVEGTSRILGSGIETNLKEVSLRATPTQGIEEEEEEEEEEKEEKEEEEDEKEEA